MLYILNRSSDRTVLERIGFEPSITAVQWRAVIRWTAEHCRCSIWPQQAFWNCNHDCSIYAKSFRLFMRHQIYRLNENQLVRL